MTELVSNPNECNFTNQFLNQNPNQILRIYVDTTYWIKVISFITQHQIFIKYKCKNYKQRFSKVNHNRFKNCHISFQPYICQFKILGTMKVKIQQEHANC